MISDDLGKRLHDKATRGEDLSSEEQGMLASWYGQQDRQETLDLSSAKSGDSIDALRSQLNDALEQLATVTQHIRDLNAASDALRREVGGLQSRLLKSAVTS